VKDTGEYAGAHVLSIVRAHYTLFDMSRLERGYPKEVGPKEADDLRDDINLCGTSTPPNQPSSDRSTREWSESSAAVDGRSAPAVSTSQAPVAPTSSMVLVTHATATSEQPEQ
jgi:hypothetical protein